MNTENMSGVDFITELPIDVVEHLLSYIAVEDTLRCLRVCKTWNSLLTSSTLDRYWKKVCVCELGLTKGKLMEYQLSHSLSKITSSTLNHQRWVSGFMSKIDKVDKARDSVECAVRTAELFQYPRVTMSRYHQVNLTRPSCFIGHNFILCSPLFIQEPNLTIAAVSTSTKTVSASSRDPLRTCLDTRRHSWVFWAKASADYVLILIQPQGRWIGYCPLTSRIVLDVSDQTTCVLLSGGCAGIASCERCFQLVTFKAVDTDTATWDLCVMRMGKPLEVDAAVSRSSDLVCTKTIVVKLPPSDRVVEWKFLPFHESCTDGQYCSSHQLVCVTNTRIHVYRCAIKPKERAKRCSDFEMIKLGEITIPSSPHHIVDPYTKQIQLTSLRCSQDGYLLGVIVSPCQLYVWDLHALQLISSTYLSCLNAEGTSVDLGAVDSKHHCRLLAVGHLYTVVAFFDEKPGGQICIIKTTSGQLMTRRESRVQWRVADEIDYIHLVSEQLLSDIFCFSSPFFIYLDRSTSSGCRTQSLSCVQFLRLPKVKSILQLVFK